MRLQLKVRERKKSCARLTSTFMKLTFGVKLRVTLVLYALSLLFLMLMFTSILSLLDLINILKAKDLQVNLLVMRPSHHQGAGAHWRALMARV